MICPRCRIKMSERKRSFHKRRKWICRRCGLVRMQDIGKRSKKN
jgi:transcription initiation factor TFIIIB Brf1 subunit/transcription initiation factor TFIIB